LGEAVDFEGFAVASGLVGASGAGVAVAGDGILGEGGSGVTLVPKAIQEWSPMGKGTAVP
jgi:hypothetical protein